MGQLVVNRGLQVIAGIASNTADDFQSITTMVFDDGTVAFTATDTNIGAAPAPTNIFPTTFNLLSRTAQTITMAAVVPEKETTLIDSFPDGATIRRISLHNRLPAGVGFLTSNSLVWGVDGLDFLKTPEFGLQGRVTLAYSN